MTYLRQCQRGSGLLEFAVVAVVISVLAWVLLTRLLYYQEVAEKAAMEYTVTSIRSAIRLHVADLILAGKVRDIPAMAQRNPVAWLKDAPPGYVGERDSAVEPEPEPGSWYFDRRLRELVYLPLRDAHFVPDAEGIRRARFKVTVQVADKLQDKAADIPAVRFDQVAPYYWLTE